MPSEIPDVNHVHALDYAHRIALEVCQLIKVSDCQLDDPLLHRMVAAHIRDEFADHKAQLIADLGSCNG